MTTRVQIEVDHVNVGPGKIVAGIAHGARVETAVFDCPMKTDFWIHGDTRLIVREATEQDVLDAGGKSVPAVVPPPPAGDPEPMKL